MAQAVKFTFHSLLAEDEPAPAPAAEVVEQPSGISEEELAVARALAFDEGRAAGRAEAGRSVENTLAATLDEIADGVSRTLADLDRELGALRVDVARLAVAVAGKLSSRLLARAPLAEVEALIAECLAEHHEEPRIVVRLAEELLDSLRARLDPLVARQGFAGRVILIGEPGFVGADCRIEWPDGGVERRTAVIEAAVAAAVGRFAALSALPSQGGTRDNEEIGE